MLDFRIILEARNPAHRCSRQYRVGDRCLGFRWECIPEGVWEWGLIHHAAVGQRRDTARLRSRRTSRHGVARQKTCETCGDLLRLRHRKQMIGASYLQWLRLLEPGAHELMPFAKRQFARRADNREHRLLNPQRLFWRKGAPEFLNRGHLDLEEWVSIRRGCFQCSRKRAFEFRAISCTADELEEKIERSQVVA